MCLISVIVPVYNVKNYLSRCVASVLAQTWADFELILVDDGSNDGSEELCQTMAERDQRIRVVRTSNRGQSVARNMGLSLARGHYVAFLDGDDFIHPQFLEVHYNMMLLTNADITISCHDEISKNETVKEFHVTDPIPWNYCSKKEAIKELFDSVIFMTVWGKLYRRSVIMGNTFLEGFVITEDVEFNSRVYSNLGKCIFINLPLYYWVKRQGSILRSCFTEKNIQQIECHIRAWTNLRYNEKYEAYALIRLYKVICSLRHYVPEYLESQLRTVCGDAIDTTWESFCRNQEIENIHKFLYRLLLRYPLIYSCFLRIVSFSVCCLRQIGPSKTLY